jgi:hypothetical protein
LYLVLKHEADAVDERVVRRGYGQVPADHVHDAGLCVTYEFHHVGVSHTTSHEPLDFFPGRMILFR